MATKREHFESILAITAQLLEQSDDQLESFVSLDAITKIDNELDNMLDWCINAESN